MDTDSDDSQNRACDKEYPEEAYHLDKDADDSHEIMEFYVEPAEEDDGSGSDDEEEDGDEDDGTDPFAEEVPRPLPPPPRPRPPPRLPMTTEPVFFWLGTTFLRSPLDDVANIVAGMARYNMGPKLHSTKHLFRSNKLLHRLLSNGFELKLDVSDIRLALAMGMRYIDIFSKNNNNKVLGTPDYSVEINQMGIWETVEKLMSNLLPADMAKAIVEECIKGEKEKLDEYSQSIVTSWKDKAETQDEAKDYETASVCGLLMYICVLYYPLGGFRKFVVDRLFSDNNSNMELLSPHIAAKLLAAANTHREKYGTGTNYFIVLAVQLLHAATSPRSKYSPSTTLVKTFKDFKERVKAELDYLASKKLLDVRSKKDVYGLLLSSVAAKVFNQKYFFTDLITDTCIAMCPEMSSDFNSEQIQFIRKKSKNFKESKVILDGHSAVVELCGPTTTFLDMCECGLFNAVQVYRLMCKDSRVIAGAGASDFALYKELKEFAWWTPFERKEPLLKFADSFLVLPAILAENNGMDIMSTLRKWHDDDKMMRMGINISTGAHSPVIIWDLYTIKESAVMAAIDFVLSWLENKAAKESIVYIYGGQSP